MDGVHPSEEAGVEKLVINLRTHLQNYGYTVSNSNVNVRKWAQQGKHVPTQNKWLSVGLSEISRDSFFDILPEFIDSELQNILIHELSKLKYNREGNRNTHYFGKTVYGYGSVCHRASMENIPASILRVWPKVKSFGNCNFNSCLTNLYCSGVNDIPRYSDDESSLDTNPIIAAIFLGATRTFCLRNLTNHSIKCANLPSGSVYKMYGKINSEWEHHIPSAPTTSYRYSLTFWLELFGFV